MSARLDQAQVLRDLSDEELRIVVEDATRIGVDPKTRSLLNDELRRRRWPELPGRDW